eukprot:jgi/Orpsp1_1/1180918/evm.model.c7180000075122.1
MINGNLMDDRLDFMNYSLESFSVNRHLLDILVFKDRKRFDAILEEIIVNIFNPSILYPHIDELKELIRPYIEKEKYLINDSYYPGIFNNYINIYDQNSWDVNCEFTSILSLYHEQAYGLKYWILGKYRYICKSLDMVCDPLYIDPSYQYPIDEDYLFNKYGEYSPNENPTNSISSTISVPTTTDTVIPPTIIPEVTLNDTFFDDVKTKRAELFELTDNEIPIFRITIPDEEFKVLKHKFNFRHMNMRTKVSTSELVKNLYDNIESLLYNITEINFINTFPEVDVKGIFYELKINDRGYPSFDVDKKLSDFRKVLYDEKVQSIENRGVSTYYYILSLCKPVFDVDNFFKELEKIIPSYDKT